MAGSTIGTIFRITTWGESHGEALGVVIDGCPSGVPLCEEDIQIYLDRRKPGKNAFSTPRQEGDKVEILSGIFEGKTTGTPISLMIRNTSQRSHDYSEIENIYRPGHADFTFDAKYGFRDYRGGGRSSGRETCARVAAGAVACKVLSYLGVEVLAYTKSIGPVEIDYAKANYENRILLPSAMLDADADKKATEYLEQAKANMDSIGGCMECVVKGLPAGIGDPVFEKLDANLAKAIMSIGAVKAVEIGDGHHVATSYGSENNDAFGMDNGEIIKKTNHAGGILGGISDGSDVILRAFVKPTPSIFQTQETVTRDKKETSINIKGRHDPVVVSRASVVMECMTALTILDAMLVNMTAKLDNIVKFYK